MATRKKKKSKLTPLEQQISDLKAQLPKQQDWRSTDEQEIIRRQIRALENPPSIRCLDPSEKIHTSFELTSPESGHTYLVEIIDLSQELYFSTTPDFHHNGLGTCKHIEAVLFHLKKRYPRLFKQAQKNGPDTPTLIVKNNELHLHGTGQLPVPRKLRLCVTASGDRKPSCSPEKLIRTATEFTDESQNHIASVRVSRQVHEWHLRKKHEDERILLHREYEQKVHSGEFPQHETLLPLYPYQREGMIHLAFKERAMVADEMGLGKTIQGIAAAALLHRLGKAKRCLIVAPASLKAEWEEQIQKFTTLPCEVVYGTRSQRIHIYENPAAFFTIVNYEQVRSDSLDINAALQPDIVILDEAQRIKNWASLTARAIKRLNSRYAFVLTGTPIENRIDELYSIVEFLDPSIFGALFRFNRDYYILDDEKGKPQGYRNLQQLRKKIKPLLLRRRKHDVETELPDRSDENRFVKLTDGQASDYIVHQEVVRRLAHLAKKRPLRFEEHQRLMGALASMRMLCDTQFILDKETRISPKLDELIVILEEALDEPNTKIIIFSEWVGMLTLIRDYLKSQKIGFAWHTGSVPQKKRRVEIKAFKEDPDCRVFLCTESGGTGLNLQNASIVINMDLPWNPAKLEQRIARAWRKGQTRPVQVINIIAEGTIEHGMLETLAMKQGLSDGVLDGMGDFNEIQLKKGGTSFLKRLEQTLEIGKQLATTNTRRSTQPPVDPALTLTQQLQKSLGEQLIHSEEHFIGDGGISKLYLVVHQHSPEVQKAILSACALCYPQKKDNPNWIEENIIVVDETTHQSFLQLQRAGLMQTNTRARRNLIAPSTNTNTKPTHTPEQLAQLKSFTAKKEEEIKAATVLIDAGLHTMAPDHLLTATLAYAQVCAIENFTTPPKALEQLSEEPYKTHTPPPVVEALKTFSPNDPKSISSLLSALIH
jgi:superfamily II DNA/RNA helicase